MLRRRDPVSLRVCEVPRIRQCFPKNEGRRTCQPVEPGPTSESHTSSRPPLRQFTRPPPPASHQCNSMLPRTGPGNKQSKTPLKALASTQRDCPCSRRTLHDGRRTQNRDRMRNVCWILEHTTHHRRAPSHPCPDTHTSRRRGLVPSSQQKQTDAPAEGERKENRRQLWRSIHRPLPAVTCSLAAHSSSARNPVLSCSCIEQVRMDRVD